MRRPNFKSILYAARPKSLSDPHSGADVMLDLVFLALGLGSFTLIGLYALAVDRL
jgi:hypothetical protein